jgi:hypothetical protein
MRDEGLLSELLAAEDESSALTALEKRGLLKANDRWVYLGSMPNNQSIVHNQQSTPAAALVEKFTNGGDAILLKKCREAGIDPRTLNAPQSMSAAVETFFGNLAALQQDKIRQFAEENLILYATGSKARPSLSIYDAGEGQLADHFPTTFCSLVYGSSDGSYKGAIPFVQGRFNMGGTGVLPFCSEKHKLQLIVSRVPPSIVGSDDHEWAFTLFCFFHSSKDPSWKYLVGQDAKILTAGIGPLGLVPKLEAKSGELCSPRERKVTSGSLVKMYDFKAPKSNVCGEQFKKLQDYLLRPSLPLRVIECRESYKANVMRVTVWDRLSAWGKDRLEEGFEDGASAEITLDSGEVIPAEIRVFKAATDPNNDGDQPQTGLRALINGQSHAKRDAQFFRAKAVDKEHIAGSLLVTLDCTELGQESRNALFMSNRETFREDPLLHDLLKKLQKELRDHEGLIELNRKRYEQKVANAVDDEEGISALEELLETDPSLADLFGSTVKGKVAAKTVSGTGGTKIPGTPTPFIGVEFPTYLRRADNSTEVSINIQAGKVARTSFQTDVKNNYFSRRNHRGRCDFVGDFKPTCHLFNGRLTFTCALDKALPIGTTATTEVTMTDNKDSGPFAVRINVTVVPAIEDDDDDDPTPKKKKMPKVDVAPSRPRIREVFEGPEAPPLTIEKVPGTQRLELLVNMDSKLLVSAKTMRPREEEAAVGFVYKFGLALVAMGLLDAAKKTDEWKSNDGQCRDNIQEAAIGIARVIVPLCLSLPKKLPRPK